jgi:hypothetical protein
VSGPAWTRLPRSRGLPRWLAAVAGVVGVVLLVSLIASIGPARIAAEIRHLGGILPIVLLITGLKYPLQAAGWRLILPRAQRPPWSASVAATLTGDSLGYITWAGPFTGEPMRALLIRDTVPVAAGIAAGAAERAVYDATAAVFVVTVIVSLLAFEHGVWAVSVALGFVAAAGFVARQLWRRRAEIGHDTGPSALQDGARNTGFREALRSVWRIRRAVLPAVAGLCLAQHALLVLESYLMLGTLSGSVTFSTAVTFEAVTKLVNTVGVVVPARLGVAEGGSALLADGLGYGASYGVSLALMRRVRALIWAAVGVTLLPLQEMRQRR